MKTCAETRGVTVSPGDRAAARTSLRRLKSPAEVLIQGKGCEVEFLAVLHTIETLMQIARPLSRALRQRLSPWLAELGRRRQQILVDNRRTDARYRHSNGAAQ